MAGVYGGLGVSELKSNNIGTKSIAELQDKILDRYDARVPRPDAFAKKVLVFFAVAGSVSSLLAIFLLIFPQVLEDILYFVHSEELEAPTLSAIEYYLILLSLFSLIWAIYRTQSTPRRVSEDVYFAHQASHIVRDFCSLVLVLNDDERVIAKEKAIKSILNSCEKAFTLAARRKCSVSIKILNEDDTVITRFTSDEVAYSVETQEPSHCLEYSSIREIIGDDSRNYLCNNVWFSFRNGKYEHPALEPYAVQGPFLSLTRMFLEYLWPPSRPISFRSTLVIPLRYVSGFPSTASEVYSPYTYLGFLCVDSKARRAFRPSIITEVGALYADAISSIFLIEKATASGAQK